MAYVTNYSKDHDILHMISDEMRLIDGSASEEHPGVYVYRKEGTAKVIGVIVMDYEAKKDSLEEIVKKYGQSM